jgi:sirohydrochlorin ferrochelatase
MLRPLRTLLDLERKAEDEKRREERRRADQQRLEAQMERKKAAQKKWSDKWHACKSRVAQLQHDEQQLLHTIGARLFSFNAAVDAIAECRKLRWANIPPAIQVKCPRCRQLNPDNDHLQKCRELAEQAAAEAEAEMEKLETQLAPIQNELRRALADLEKIDRP